MMIKSWYKYNESLQELTREMVVDVIYYRNFTLLSFDEKLSHDIDSFINRDLEPYIDFSSEDTTFINRQEYRQAQEQIDQIYQVVLENPQIKEKLISIYNRIKKYLNKTSFSDYEDFFIEYIDQGYDIEFLFKPHDCMEIELKKVVSDITDHINLLGSVSSTVKRIAKIYGFPDGIVYISESDYSDDGGSHIESHVKIKIL